MHMPIQIRTHSIYAHTHIDSKTEPGVDVWTQTSEWKADHSCTVAMNTEDQCPEITGNAFI